MVLLASIHEAKAVYHWCGPDREQFSAKAAPFPSRRNWTHARNSQLLATSDETQVCGEQFGPREVLITLLCRGLFPRAISDSRCPPCTRTPGGRGSSPKSHSSRPVSIWWLLPFMGTGIIYRSICHFRLGSNTSPPGHSGSSHVWINI